MKHNEWIVAGMMLEFRFAGLSMDASLQVVIRKMEMQAKGQGMDSLRWEVADMLSLPFADDSFDVVLEKGTMDVLFVDNDSPWSPRTEVCTRVHQMLGETHRSGLCIPLLSFLLLACLAFDCLSAC